MMIVCMIHDPDTRETKWGGEELLAQWAGQEKGWLWLEFDDEDKEREGQILINTFGADPLVVTDAQRERHPPKVEVFDDYLFLLLRGLDAQTKTIEFGTIQIALFVGRRFLVTRHSAPSPSVARALEEAREGKLDLSRGPVDVAYRVCRLVTDRYAPIVQGLEQRLEQLEEEIVEDPRDEVLAQLMHYKGKLRRLRRVFTYQQSVFAELARVPHELIGKRQRHQFNDVYEQMERLASLSSLYQELAGDLIDGYISLNSHRLNQIMKVLTIVAVIFLPLTLLVGVYGMNFENMPELQARYGYYVLLAVMTLIGLGLLFLFRRLRWL